MIAAIGADKSLGYNLDMGFIIVPPDQKRVPVKILRVSRGVGPGPVPAARQRAHRELAAAAQRGHEGACPRRARPSRTCSATAPATATSSSSIP